MTATNYTPKKLFNNKKAVPKAFNRVAKLYDLATYLSQGYQIDLDKSAHWLNLKGDETVLDLCCGTGKSTSACLKLLPNGKITGVDNSEGMLEVASKKFDSEIKEGKVNLFLQDAMSLDLPDESYDAVFTAYGLRNMPDFDLFLKGVHGVLKSGGKIGIHDYSLKSNGWAKTYWKVLGYGFIVPFCTVLTGSSTIFRYLIKSVVNFLPPEKIVELLEKNGFKDVQIHEHSSWRKPILHTITAVKI
ncbi:MAG: class I SAM-dependent methyltransferase [Chitinophagales bacterium]